jgi:hypothetical protein
MDHDVMHTLHKLVIESNDKRHPKCESRYDSFTGDYWCGYNTTVECQECKYGGGRKDPEAKCNRNVKKAAPKGSGT